MTNRDRLMFERAYYKYIPFILAPVVALVNTLDWLCIDTRPILMTVLPGVIPMCKALLSRNTYGLCYLNLCAASFAGVNIIDCVWRHSLFDAPPFVLPVLGILTAVTMMTQLTLRTRANETAEDHYRAERLHG